MKKVRVELGRDSYDIFIGSGLADETKAFLRARDYSPKTIVVTDTNIAPLYGKKIVGLLGEAGLKAEIFPVTAGENSKTLQTAEKLYTRAIEAGLDRKSAIFALGGGVTGDLAGFVAATYMRGVPFVELPTSLLSQVDSSVGGKVGVNHALGKNLIGAFYQPDAVFIDLDMLATLPKREIATGLGEIVKYGVIYDEKVFSFLEQNAEKVLSLDPEAIAYLVARSCDIKAAVVGEDEKEAGLRRILNFGHTLGHAVEQETNYLRYNHGEAVAIGMAGAAYISESLGMTDAKTVARLVSLMESLNLPVTAAACKKENIYAAIFRDKKTVGGKVNWVLMNGIGSVAIKNDVPETIVRAAIEKIIR